MGSNINSEGGSASNIRLAMICIMKENRITILLGAGAMVEATNVSTNSLTKNIIDNCKNIKWRDDRDNSLVDEIYKLLQDYFPKDSELINFEDIFHAIEIMPSVINKKNIKKGFSSMSGIFSNIKPEFDTMKKEEIYGSEQIIIDTINEEINNYNNKVNNDENKWFKEFFSKLIEQPNTHYDLYSLNYDTWLEEIFVDYCDGFESINGYDNMLRFNPQVALNMSGKNSINHLHGQICFEYESFRKEDMSKFAYKDPFDILYKYKTYDDAKRVREYTVRSGTRNQAGDNIFRTNIITGLMKTDKLLRTPFDIYQMRLFNSLMNSNKIIIIGYGFSDLYVNNMLEQFNNIHYENRKIVLIDYVDSKHWHPERLEWLKPGSKASYVRRIFKNDGCTQKMCFKEPIKFISDDGMSKLYLQGFKKVAEDFTDEIIDFICN